MYPYPRLLQFSFLKNLKKKRKKKKKNLASPPDPRLPSVTFLANCRMQRCPRRSPRPRHPPTGYNHQLSMPGPKSIPFLLVQIGIVPELRGHPSLLKSICSDANGKHKTISGAGVSGRLGGGTDQTSPMPLP